MKFKMQILWLGMASIAFLYSAFFTYFCMAKPIEPNSTEINSDRIIENANSLKLEDAKKETSIQERNIEIDAPSALGKDKIDAIGPEFYLREIIAFYERIITLLFGVIGVIMVFSFVYVHLTSKRQAEEMATDALETKSFIIVLKSMIATEAREFFEEYSIPELQKKIEFLEEQVNIQSYELSDEGTDEVNDGNN